MVFLTKSKNPPLDIVQAFLRLHGHTDGGCIHTDQGGELASSFAFGDLLLKEFGYTLGPTGADSLSQNGAVEIYNDKLGIRTRSLLYGLGCMLLFVLLLRLDLDRHSNLHITHNTAYY
jgi:hypothetical protein